MGTRAADGATKKRGRWTLRRVALWAGLLLAGGLVAGEIGSRTILGLGDPPLFKLDPDMEYVLVPSQSCRRFGHDVVVNRWSMRGEDFEESRGPGERRVLVLGDSVVYGGAKIDQSELATTLLKARLKGMSTGGGMVTVGNASAPSWGPPNELGYVKRYGVLNADVVVLVLNSDDVADVPGLEYIGSAWPRQKPAVALQELLGVYVWKGVCRALGRPAEPDPPAHTTSLAEDEGACRAAFGELVERVRKSGARPIVVQHLKRSEVTGAAGEQRGYRSIRGWAEEAGVSVLSDGERMRTALSDGKGDPYLPGDDIHPSPRGQAILSEVLLRAVLDSGLGATGAGDPGPGNGTPGGGR